MKIIAGLIGVIIISLMLTSEKAGAEQKEVSGGIFDALSISLDVAFLYGPIDGFVQTPKGGNPGSTSSKRPTFEELGFDTISIYEGSIRADWDAHSIFGGAQIARLSGRSRLDEELTSQNVTFPAGSFVDADIQLDWYWLEYLYRFDLSPGGRRNVFTVAPGAGISVFAFHYKLDGSGEEGVDRQYPKVGIRMGCELTWMITDKLSAHGRAFGSLPIPNTPQILDLELVGRYQLWKSRRVKGLGYLGIAYDRIDYKDEQTVPNHILVEMGPMLKAGLQIQF